VTVRMIWQRFLDTGSTNDRPKSGRQPKASERERICLCRYSKANLFAIARQMYEEVGGPSAISISTLKRYLGNEGLFEQVSIKKPLLTKPNIQKRIAWCKGYSNYIDQDWKEVIFSDEVRISMHSTCRRYVRRRIGHSLKFQYVTKTVKYGGKSILLWRAIKGDGTRTLVRCPFRLNSKEYQAVLSKGLFHAYDTSNIFVQDGATCHKSLCTMQFLEEKKVCLMEDWPTFDRPDLNICQVYFN